MTIEPIWNGSFSKKLLRDAVRLEPGDQFFPRGVSGRLAIARAIVGVEGMRRIRIEDDLALLALRFQRLFHFGDSVIRDAGVMPGITLRPATPIQSILPFLSEVELVLIMTVNPGFSGQSFMHDQIKKIEVIRNEAERLGKDLFIEVDGGIDNKTSKDVIAAGANVLVAGNYVFKNDYAKAIRVLKGAP